MKSEPKDVDAWDMGRGTDLAVPSVAIVHVRR